MGDLKTKLSSVRAKLLRRSSTTSANSNVSFTGTAPSRHSKHSTSLTELRDTTPSLRPQHAGNESIQEEVDSPGLSPEGEDESGQPCPSKRIASRRTESLNSREPQTIDSSLHSLPSPDKRNISPAVTLEEPTPEAFEKPQLKELLTAPSPDSDQAGPLPSAPLSPRGRPNNFRRQSLVADSNQRFIKTLLASDAKRPATGDSQDYFSGGPPTLSANMLHRKIWVKRTGGSPTLVMVKEDDLVDDVRDLILRKYANSLGRSFDSPDVTIRIVAREQAQGTVGRPLGPEEDICRTLDAYYPGGQMVDEALIIDVPQRRTPKPSPRAIHQHHVGYYIQDDRPMESGTDYFPPMNGGAASPAALTSASHESRASHAHERAMAVLTTGHVPALPSPGGTRRLHQHRPKYPRQHTSSPTNIIQGPSAAASSTHLPARPSRPRQDSAASDHPHLGAAQAPPLPTPPIPEVPTTVQKQSSAPSTPRVSSPNPTKKRSRKQNTNAEGEHLTLPSALLADTVPPINVLIVEDNNINLKLLEQFMRRLNVRWQTAVNGREAVTKWRTGGFHLVLMDIQLPIMSGLEATKEIRRLEKVNSIGVFSHASSSTPEVNGELKGEDKLGDELLFKSPVIIVALTASSLQSDRHEALAAGCNDFLTKPVSFVWLERKVKEWGCMQALIDFDGWRKWKDFATQSATEKEKEREKEKEEKEKEKQRKKANRKSRQFESSSSGSAVVAPA